MIPITQDLISVNFTRRKAGRPIEWIVIHYFGGLGDDAGVVNYFDRVGVNASAHYALDDDSITQAVLDSDTSWHCGDCGRGTYKAKCCNANSLGIEVRPYKINSKHISAADTDWYFHEQTIANLKELVKTLMDKYNIDVDHVIRHYDVTGKLCPRPWVGDDINTYYGKTGNQLWAEFKASLEETEMRYNTINEIPDYAKATVQKLIDRGALSGTGMGLNISEDMLRIFVINDRMGLYK